MIRILFNKIGQIGAVIFSFLSLIFFFRNKSLSKENKELNLEKEDLERSLRLQKKLKDAIKNTKHTTLAGNIERMREDNRKAKS